MVNIPYMDPTGMLTPCAYHTIVGVTVGTDSQLFFLAGSGFTDSFLRGTLWRRSSWNVIGIGRVFYRRSLGGARVCGVEVVVVSHLGNQTDSDVCYRCSVNGRSDKMNNNHVRILRGLVEESFSTESVFCLRMCTYYFCLAHDFILAIDL